VPVVDGGVWVEEVVIPFESPADAVGTLYQPLEAGEQPNPRGDRSTCP